MTDRELLLRLKKDPNAALTELNRRYAPLAAGIAGRILPGRVPDIEEVAADTLITLWRSAESLQAETLRGFVITTARNLAIDRWRQLRRRSEAPLFDNDAEDSAFLEQTVLGGMLAEYIQALSPPDGEIFLRHYELEQSIPAIARELALSPSAVKMRLFRGRRAIRKQLEERGITIEDCLT